MEDTAEDREKENCILEVQWRWELGWELRYQTTGRELGKNDYSPVHLTII